MKLTIVEDQNLAKDHLILKCHKTDAQIEHIQSYIETLDTTILGTLQTEKYFLKPSEIYYFESVEKQTFLYTKDHVLKCALRLYELEAILGHQCFIRISKSVLINMLKIKSIHPLLNRNLSITLTNDETIICSRHYVNPLKKKLMRR